jgi:hypothetical protein
MMSFLGTAVLAASVVPLVSFNTDSLLMYGLVALVIGLIAWSKYNEPAPSDPYAKRKPVQDLPATAGHADLGPVVAVPVAGTASSGERLQASKPVR